MTQITIGGLNLNTENKLHSVTTSHKRTKAECEFAVFAGEFKQGFKFVATVGTTGTYFARTEKSAIARMKSNAAWWARGEK